MQGWLIKMIKMILNCKFHLRFLINPFIRFKSNNLGEQLCINKKQRQCPIIISLTSFEERFSDLELSIYSLLNQSILPDKIILWFSNNYTLSDLPYSITKYVKNGLEIRFVKDIGSYTKIIYALKEFGSSSIIVTADDDIYYPADWLEKLYLSYTANPKDIHVHRAHRVLLQNGNILPYEQWNKHVQEETARYDNFLTGVGGVLYPPKCFIKEVFRSDIFLAQSPCADDMWLWLMAILSDRKIRVVKEHIKTLTCTNIFRQLGLGGGRTLYTKNRLGFNDVQLDNLMELYRANIMKKLTKL